VICYEGEADTITVAYKKPKNAACTDVQQQLNSARNEVRAIGERGNSLLKPPSKPLRNVSLCPWEYRQDQRGSPHGPAHRPHLAKERRG
jgi:hypothetical protein